MLCYMLCYQDKPQCHISMSNVVSLQSHRTNTQTYTHIHIRPTAVSGPQSSRSVSVDAWFMLMKLYHNSSSVIRFWCVGNAWQTLVCSPPGLPVSPL